MYLLLIFTVATLLATLPRTLAQVGWLGFLSVFLIGMCGLVTMIGAGANPVPGRIIQATASNSFFEAFLAVTGPVRTSAVTLTQGHD